MSSRQQLRDTKTEWIGNKCYCSFCGNEAKTDYDFDEYNRSDYYFCDCEASKRFLQKEDLKVQIKALTNERKLQKLRYNEEVKELMRKYDIKNV